MSQPIKSNQFSHGAGKGDEPRPVDRRKYRKNFDQIAGIGKMVGAPVKEKNGKITYSYTVYGKAFSTQ
jgi:hypothetical protein